MEVDQLRYFLKIADSGSYTRAAEELGITQPALSRSIQKLESELGRPVFERTMKSIRLTETGELLQPRARQILDIINDTKMQVRDDGQSGTVRIGAIPTVAPYYLPSLLKSFSSKFPNAQVIVQEDTTEHLLKKCTQGDIDAALIALPIQAQYLDILELFDEELLIVLPADHRLAEKPKLTFKDIEDEPFVLLDEAHCLSDNIISFCRRKLRQPVSVERTSQLATVQELVSLAHGISMIPAMARNGWISRRAVYIGR